MKRGPIFSVVVEASTREVTEIFSLEKSVRFFQKELKRSFPDNRFEIIVSANYSRTFKSSSKNLRWVVAPRAGYFGLKNAGFKAARGLFVAFWDSDCRPFPGYALQALRRLVADPSLCGVAGASFYMGHSYWGRLETILSYGKLHVSEGPMTHDSPLAHNLVLRKSRFPKPPFGSFIDRMGGDDYVSRYAVQLGGALWLDPKLHMRHERQDIASAPAKGLEKRMLELTYPLLHRRVKSPWWALPLAARSALVGAVKRIRKLMLYRKCVSFTWWETLLALPAIFAIFTLDCLLILAMFFWPPLLKKTLRYQGGEKWREIQRYMDKVTPKQYRVRSNSIFAREGWASRKAS